MLLLPPPIPSKIPPLNPINKETAGGIRKGLEKKEMDTGGGGCNKVYTKLIKVVLITNILVKGLNVKKLLHLTLKNIFLYKNSLSIMKNAIYI